MKLILRADLADLGKRGDLVEVADGYARNYLIPKHLAMPSTPGASAQADSMRRARDQRDAAAREQAEEMATKLVTAAITITAKAADVSVIVPPNRNARSAIRTASGPQESRCWNRPRESGPALSP